MARADLPLEARARAPTAAIEIGYWRAIGEAPAVPFAQRLLPAGASVLGVCVTCVRVPRASLPGDAQMAGWRPSPCLRARGYWLCGVRDRLLGRGCVLIGYWREVSTNSQSNFMGSIG